MSTRTTCTRYLIIDLGNLVHWTAAGVTFVWFVSSVAGEQVPPRGSGSPVHQQDQRGRTRVSERAGY